MTDRRGNSTIYLCLDTAYFTTCYYQWTKQLGKYCSTGKCTDHMWPLGACSETWLVYWNAGCTLENIGSWQTPHRYMHRDTQTKCLHKTVVLPWINISSNNQHDADHDANWMLVCWWWWSDWSFARLIAPVVTTTSIILCFNKHRLTQVHLENGH